MPEIIVVHGYIGSGKSTQCSLLASSGLGETRVQHVSAGNRLRAIRTGAEPSRFAAYINAPDAPSPLPDWIVGGAIFEPIDNDNSTLTLIDGYPRHPQAVESFHGTVLDKGHKLLGTIAMHLSMGSSIERIVARGKRDGERVQGADMREFTKYRYQLDIQTTNLAIDVLSKIAPVRFVDATDDIPTVHSRFIEGIRYLRQQNCGAEE
jgi:adenylate kinase family enzyme